MFVVVWQLRWVMLRLGGVWRGKVWQLGQVRVGYVAFVWGLVM
jgi:hypothetical protein